MELLPLKMALKEAESDSFGQNRGPFLYPFCRPVRWIPPPTRGHGLRGSPFEENRIKLLSIDYLYKSSIPGNPRPGAFRMASRVFGIVGIVAI